MEGDSFAGQALGAIFFRIRHLKFFFVAGAQPEQVPGERLEGIRAAHFQHHFLLLDRFAFDSGGAFQRHHGEIAIFDRPRIQIDEIGLLVSQFFQAFSDVFVSDFRIVVVDSTPLYSFSSTSGTPRTRL